MTVAEDSYALKLDEDKELDLDVSESLDDTPDADDKPKKLKSKASAKESKKKTRVLIPGEIRKERHIAAEKKRRQAIREEYDRIVEVVPCLESKHSRSEKIVLTKTVEYVKMLINENAKLKSRCQMHGLIDAGPQD